MTVSLFQHHSVQSFTPGSMELTTATFCGTYLNIETVLQYCDVYDDDDDDDDDECNNDDDDDDDNSEDNEQDMTSL